MYCVQQNTFFAGLEGNLLYEMQSSTDGPQGLKVQMSRQQVVIVSRADGGSGEITEIVKTRNFDR